MTITKEADSNIIGKIIDHVETTIEEPHVEPNEKIYVDPHVEPNEKSHVNHWLNPLLNQLWIFMYLLQM